MNRLLLLAAVVSMAACQSDPVTSVAPVSEARVSVPITVPANRSFAPDEAYDTYASRIFKAVYDKNASWQDADRDVRAAVEAYGNGPVAYQIQQEAGGFMLRERLFKAEASPERTEAIAYYTDLLLRNRHGDPQTMATALTALKGTWDAPRIEAAASQAESAAEAFAVKSGGCGAAGDCTGIFAERRIAEAIEKTGGQRFVQGMVALDAL